MKLSHTTDCCIHAQLQELQILKFVGLSHAALTIVADNVGTDLS